MKILYCLLVAAIAATTTTVAMADVGPVRTTTVTTCTSESKSSEVPSGTNIDSHGRKWAGFKADGTPPDGLTTDSTSMSCTTKTVEITPP